MCMCKTNFIYIEMYLNNRYELKNIRDINFLFFLRLKFFKITKLNK